MRDLIACALLVAALARCAHQASTSARAAQTGPSSGAVQATSARPAAPPLIEVLAVPAHPSMEENGIVSLAEPGLPREVTVPWQRRAMPARVTGRWRWNSAHGPRFLTSVCFEVNPTVCVLLYSAMGEADNGERSFMAEFRLDADVRGSSPLEVDLLRSSAQRVVVRGSTAQCAFTVAIDSQRHEGMASESDDIGETACVGS